MSTRWATGHGADSNGHPPQGWETSKEWLEFFPCWGTMALQEALFVGAERTDGGIWFDAPHGTLFYMTEDTFSTHDCLRHIERLKLTGHWEMANTGITNDVHEWTSDRWGAETTRRFNGAVYTFEIRWYPFDPMVKETKEKIQAALDDLPAPLFWRGCHKRPLTTHDLSSNDYEPCYYQEADLFLNPETGQIVKHFLRRYCNGNDDFTTERVRKSECWPIRVKPSVRQNQLRR